MRLNLEEAPGVSQVVPILKPYKLSSTELRGGKRTVLDIGGKLIGAGGGGCSRRREWSRVGRHGRLADGWCERSRGDGQRRSW